MVPRCRAPTGGAWRCPAPPWWREPPCGRHRRSEVRGLLPRGSREASPPSPWANAQASSGPASLAGIRGEIPVGQLCQRNVEEKAATRLSGVEKDEEWRRSLVRVRGPLRVL